MGSKIDIVGEKFGSFTVVEMAKVGNKYIAICKCECGTVERISTYRLTRSIGDLRCKNCRLSGSDITGEVYGDFTVIGMDEERGSRRKAIVKCKCGRVERKYSSHLKKGATVRCGHCGNKHGMFRTGLHEIYRGMKCASKDFGIPMCEEFKRFFTFYEWAMSSGYKEGMHITRAGSKEFSPRTCSFCETTSPSAHNSPKKSFTTSIYKGVHLKGSKWRARIHQNRVVYELGAFFDEKDAARAYNKKARELYGDLAYQNIIEED